jgi:hypothetical protein
MVPDPYQSGHLLVGLRNALSKGWLYESTDYGVTWHPIVLPQKDLACIQDIAFHPETQGLVYLATCGTGVYRSTDSGNTWKRIDDPQQPDMQNGWKIAIATHPEPMVLVGTNQYPYVSKDGGETWESTQNSPGAFAFMFLNEDSTRLYATTWRGLVLSRDGGNSWEQAAGAIGKVRTTAMDYTKTENYTILYAATSGGDPGATSSTVMQNPQRAGITENNLVDAGIYRYVQRTWKVFLPALRKGK